MSWRDIKAEARKITHKTFSFEALYSDSQVTDVECNVRHHRKSQYIGEDYQEFSPGIFSEINRVIIDTDEVIPEGGGTLRLLNVPGLKGQSDLVLQIENFEDQGNGFLLCEVRVVINNNG